ncbi:hypothetical protein [Roseimicrobium sp. ORNL1]|nr:hypothetical protein [Roseimicrobium sp. ORNL1]QIF00081.1 hypothetical protein G5S37_00615 [Roseimicrobium sp. ORNL1]
MKKAPATTRPDKAISLHPLTAEQAIAAALRVKPADLKKAAQKEREAKKK